MVAMLLALIILVLLGAVTIGFITWAIQEHQAASKYRMYEQVIERSKHVEQPAQPAQPSGPTLWKITYKEGRTTRTVTVPGATESLALRELVKTAGAGVYSSIVLIAKI